LLKNPDFSGFDPEKSGFFFFTERERNNREREKGENSSRRSPVRGTETIIYASLRRKPWNGDRDWQLIEISFVLRHAGYD
jgi:hypothetical protein